MGLHHRRNRYLDLNPVKDTRTLHCFNVTSFDVHLCVRALPPDLFHNAPIFSQMNCECCYAPLYVPSFTLILKSKLDQNMKSTDGEGQDI